MKKKKLTGQQREALKDVLVKWRDDRAKQFGFRYFFHVLDANEVPTISILDKKIQDFLALLLFIRKRHIKINVSLSL